MLAQLAAAISTPILPPKNLMSALIINCNFTQRNTDVNPDTIRLRAGTEINKSLAVVEAQVCLSVSSDTALQFRSKMETKIDSYYSIFKATTTN